MESVLSSIVGLGNPGANYAETRHNVGFWFVDLLARRWSVQFSNDRKLRGETALATTPSGRIRLLKPGTFVNRSGESVAALLNYYRLAPESCLVVYDELDLPAGVVRFKFGGGHGGHNGVRDIIRHLGSPDFPRLRLGIGHPGHKSAVTGYVLSRPGRADEALLNAGLEASLAVIDDYVSGAWNKATAQLHTTTRATEPGNGE